jgi:hypothetical protein
VTRAYRRTSRTQLRQIESSDPPLREHGAPPPRPWSAYLAEILADGRWHPRAEVVAQVVSRASSEAGRPFAARLGRSATRHGGFVATRQLGKRIAELAKDGLIERVGEEERQRIRWKAAGPGDGSGPPRRPMREGTR